MLSQNLTWRGSRNSSAIKNICCSSRGSSLIPKTHIHWFTTTCNFSSRGSHPFLWTPKAPTQTQNTLIKNRNKALEYILNFKELKLRWRAIEKKTLTLTSGLHMHTPIHISAHIHEHTNMHRHRCMLIPKKEKKETEESRFYKLVRSNSQEKWHLDFISNMHITG